MSITVGSRELKNRLGTYLRMVRDGVVIVVTDRGRPVAELRRIGPPEDQLEERLRYLAATGLVSLGASRELAPFRPIEIEGASLSDSLAKDREDRV